MMSIPATDPVSNRRENIDAVDQYGETALTRASQDSDTAEIIIQHLVEAIFAFI